MSTAAFNADLWAWIFQSVETNTLWGVTLLRFARYPHIALCIVRRQTLSDVWTIVHNDYADRAARLANQARQIQFWQTWEQHVAAVFAIEKICHQVIALHLAAGKRQVHSSVNETGEPAVVPMRQTRELRSGFATKVCNSMGQVSEKRWLNGSLLDLPHIRAVTLYGFHSLSSIILTFSWHGVTLALRESKRNWSTWTPDLILSCTSVSLPSTCPLVSTMPESFDPWNWHHGGYGAVQTQVWGGSSLSTVNFSALGCSSVEWGRDLVGQQFGVSLRERCRSAQESTTCSTKGQHAGLAPEVHSKFQRLRCLALQTEQVCQVCWPKICKNLWWFRFLKTGNFDWTMMMINEWI